MPIIDYESTKSIKEMLNDSENGRKDIDPNLYFARYALSTSLTLNYGIKIEGRLLYRHKTVNCIKIQIVR